MNLSDMRHAPESPSTAPTSSYTTCEDASIWRNHALAKVKPEMLRGSQVAAEQLSAQFDKLFFAGVVRLQ